MKRNSCFILILSLFSLICNAQAYRHIGLEDGLSNRKVYSILKDRTGYMWFLTHKGIDRYDGKKIKHYALKIDGYEISSLQDLNWLYSGMLGGLWEVSKRGRIFKYDTTHDEFRIVYEIPETAREKTPTPISYSFIDSNNTIWLCGERIVYLYMPSTNTARQYETHIPGNITYMCQYNKDSYFIGTDFGIRTVVLGNDSIQYLPNEVLDQTNLQVNNLYYDKSSKKLFIGTFQKGLYIFDTATNTLVNNPQSVFTDVTITKIKSLNENELLIATDGAGVFKLNTTSHYTEQYIVANYNQESDISGNNINDIYIDSEGRIWLANYPMGISIRDDRYSNYNLYTHTVGDRQSLVNNKVNCIIEDSEDDLWFATNNGVSYYNTKTSRWHSFLSSFDATYKESNYVFLSVCESEPGIFYVGGYSSNIYKIDKKKLTASKIVYETDSNNLIKPDKYIRSIIKGAKGNLWVGSYYNLKRIHMPDKTVEYYPDFEDVTVLLEKDEESIWVGSGVGLFLLNKKTREYQKIDLPTQSTYIYSLCQTEDNKLYIGTNGSGLLVYDIDSKLFKHFHRDNSSLISNNIYTIIASDKDNVILSTGSGLTRLYYPTKDDFHNWTKEQGLRIDQFDANSGTVRKNGNFLFGSVEGVIELESTIQLPLQHPSKMVLSEFSIFYEPVYPGDPGSPLKKDINETETLTLNYNQNTFSLTVSSINYDYPSDVIYSWRLGGFYDNWSVPSSDNQIRFTNINPGKYTLQMRAIANENKEITEERSMQIIIRKPYWRSNWAILFYITLTIASIILIIRLTYLRKQRKISEEKFQFFINTAHDIRTPLTLVKAPLEEISNNEKLTPEGNRNMNTALRNVNVLLRLTNNLINFEHTDIYSSELYIAEHELNTMLSDIIKSFQPYATTKKIEFTYEKNFKYLNVWFDKEKMDSIIRNIISNALKYTPIGGAVTICASESAGHWSIEVKDTGIGIPASEQKKIFKDHFRGTNAINSKVSGSGIGMVLVGRLAKLHRGKIALRSAEGQGTVIRISFPKGYNHFRRAHLAGPFQKNQATEEFNITPIIDQTPVKLNTTGKKILIVEDNDELRSYLSQTLSEEYQVQACENGKDALLIVKEYMPELIISDIMMPEMRGDELCAILKNDIDTSHIPIILLTALNDEKSILKGIQTGADEYVIKPFNVGILKATIANLLANRARLKHKFAKLEIIEENTEDDGCSNCTTDIDWKFMANLRAAVEKNIDDTEFNVDSLCAEMNMSRTSLYNKIKALTDTSPSDFIRVIRLKKAGELLKEDKYNVTEVAEMTGFNDAKYFREVFKKHFGVSPSKYKNKE